MYSLKFETEHKPERSAELKHLEVDVPLLLKTKQQKKSSNRFTSLRSMMVTSKGEG